MKEGFDSPVCSLPGLIMIGIAWLIVVVSTLIPIDRSKSSGNRGLKLAAAN